MNNRLAACGMNKYLICFLVASRIDIEPLVPFLSVWVLLFSSMVSPIAFLI